MVKLFKKVDSKHEIAIAIKKNYEAGMRPKDIAELFNLSKQRVNYWLHHEIQIKRQRREKLTRNERLIIIKWEKDKSISMASARKIQIKFIDSQKAKRKIEFKKKIYSSTANKTLNKYSSKSKNAKKFFS